MRKSNTRSRASESPPPGDSATTSTSVGASATGPRAVSTTTTVNSAAPPAWRSTSTRARGSSRSDANETSTASTTPRAAETPRLEPPRHGFTITHAFVASRPSRSNHARSLVSTACRVGDERASRSSARNTGNPNEKSAEAQSRLSKAAAAAPPPAPTKGTPASSRTACRLPSSPNAPCTAGNAIARLEARCDASEAGSGKNESGESPRRSRAESRPRSLKSKSLGVLLYICLVETAYARSARSK